jgi:hypothetical protein
MPWPEWIPAIWKEPGKQVSSFTPVRKKHRVSREKWKSGKVEKQQTNRNEDLKVRLKNVT